MSVEICTAHGCHSTSADGDEGGLPGSLCDGCEQERWDGMLEEPFQGTMIPKAAIPFQARPAVKTVDGYGHGEELVAGGIRFRVETPWGA